MQAMDWLLSNPEPPPPLEENEDVCFIEYHITVMCANLLIYFNLQDELARALAMSLGTEGEDQTKGKGKAKEDEPPPPPEEEKGICLPHRLRNV